MYVCAGQVVMVMVVIGEGGYGMFRQRCHVRLQAAASVSRDCREHWFPSDTRFSLMASRSFLTHTPVTTFAGLRNVVRGWCVSN